MNCGRYPINSIEESLDAREIPGAKGRGKERAGTL
jgi:hypothetical protein